MEERSYRVVGKPHRKKDAMQLLLGKPVYVQDVTPDNALVVRLLRSPHPNAIVRSIRADAARKVPDVVAVYTWEDVPQTRFAIAGQTYPEPSPYDRLIIDRHVRFVGDVVAIVAAETEKAAQKALKLIKVDYELLEPVLQGELLRQICAAGFVLVGCIGVNFMSDKFHIKVANFLPGLLVPPLWAAIQGLLAWAGMPL